ncbi:NAD-dependent deacetylase sir2D-like [Condylostylus longicornis]|uniref:NAD-dependent deacetylase sir2D-like n=1 Tax=Condylostylus longicornis TaxID=2530218 RepID=UPI00244E4050|nr:NAD-dependent deacetylase sir2D-like [Condylostylus longicornis]
MNNIEELDLSSNNYTILNLNILNDLRMLQKLYINNNQLKEIDYKHLRISKRGFTINIIELPYYVQRSHYNDRLYHNYNDEDSINGIKCVSKNNEIILTTTTAYTTLHNEIPSTTSTTISTTSSTTKLTSTSLKTTTLLEEDGSNENYFAASNNNDTSNEDIIQLSVSSIENQNSNIKYQKIPLHSSLNIKLV